MLLFYSQEWSNAIEGYSTSNEDKTATRLPEGQTRVLYSSGNSYCCGFPITFRVLDAGEKTPFDGIGLSANDEDIETLQRSNSIFVATSGNLLVLILTLSFKIQSQLNFICYIYFGKYSKH